jgi:hypothetical protein
MLLVDACGAVATAMATYFLLASERLRTGLPPAVLTGMAVAALAFAIFDIVCLLLKRNATDALRVIACCNLLYCGIAGVLLILFWKDVTALGLVYFAVEIAIVVSISIWEWRLAGRTEVKSLN